jgi:hypothetical protein
MTRGLVADTRSMDTCDSWKCPGCGALVVLPTACPLPVDALGERRLDQLAQASCGCWVTSLSDRGVARLLDAIVALDDDDCYRSWTFAGRAS